MKRFFTFLTIAATLSSLAACSSSGASTPSTYGTTETLQTTAQKNMETQEETDKETEMVYGTATLTYAEFYSGDVSSTEGFDAVSSATNSKYATFPNVATDFVDENTNADGYHLIGVKNVNVAVPADVCEEFLAINPSFVRSEGEAPAQYKTVSVENGKAVYSATTFHVVDTVTDATAKLLTGTVWGDYQINVYDGETIHLRNTRENDFDVNGDIQGIILETAGGLKVGMEALQSIWVQTYEVSFNVLDDNTHNTHIAAYDNLAELSKLVGETVTRIVYIMPDSTYVYEFDGIYIKPIYTESITAVLNDDVLTLSTDDFGSFTNAGLTVTYKIGSGRQATIYTLSETALENGTATYKLDLSSIADAEDGGVYSAVVSSDTYADITVAIPMSADQRKAMESLISDAQTRLTENPDNASTIEEHIDEAQELLADESASSAEAGELYAELSGLIAPKER